MLHLLPAGENRSRPAPHIQTFKPKRERKPGMYAGLDGYISATINITWAVKSNTIRARIFEIKPGVLDKKRTRGTKYVQNRRVLAETDAAQCVTFNCPSNSITGYYVFDN